MRTWLRHLVSLVVTLFLVGLTLPALAQEGTVTGEELVLFTDYPSQVIGFDESPSFDLTLRTRAEPQIVDLTMEEMPEGWTATFRGGGTVIRSVYVEPEDDASVTLRLEPPTDVSGGTHRFVVVARGEGATAQLPLELTVQERVPARLSLEVDLPTQRGTPSGTFRYSAELSNEGDEEITVNLTAEAPSGWEVTIESGGNEITSLPLAASSTERLTVEADPYLEIPAGTYPILVRAEGGGTSAELSLVAEVTGEEELNVTAPDGRLSAEAEAGQDTPLTVIVQNTGTAPARGIEMSASQPSDWTVTFDPEQISEIPAGQQVEVTAHVRPGEQVLNGDYMITVRARPEGGSSESAEFRITVLTSTLWGVVGVALIAVAVGVVALAVLRFGRR